MQCAHHTFACRDSLLCCGFNFVAFCSFHLFHWVVLSILSLCLWSGKFCSVCFTAHQVDFLFDPFKSQALAPLIAQPVTSCRKGRASPMHRELQLSWSLQHISMCTCYTWTYYTWTYYTWTYYTHGLTPANNWWLYNCMTIGHTVTAMLPWRLVSSKLYLLALFSLLYEMTVLAVPGVYLSNLPLWMILDSSL